MLWDRQIVLPSIARSSAELNVFGSEHPTQLAFPESSRKGRNEMSGVGQTGKCRRLGVKSPLPRRTDIVGSTRYFRKVPKRNDAPQQSTSLFDHLVGADEQ